MAAIPCISCFMAFACEALAEIASDGPEASRISLCDKGCCLCACNVAGKMLFFTSDIDGCEPIQLPPELCPQSTRVESGWSRGGLGAGKKSGRPRQSSVGSTVSASVRKTLSDSGKRPKKDYIVLYCTSIVLYVIVDVRFDT